MTDKRKHSSNKSMRSTDTLDRAHRVIRQKENRNIMFYQVACYTMIFSLVMLILFFVFVAPVEHLLSKFSVALMIISAMIRIGITVSTIRKAKKIQRINKSLDTTELTVSYHSTRTFIHSTISPILFVTLTLGFCGVLPEFSLYLEALAIVIIIIAYIIAAVIIGTIINKNIEVEVQSLARIIDLKVHLSKNDLTPRNDYIYI